MDFLDTPTGTALLILVGVLPFVFLLDPVPEIAKGAFGLEKKNKMDCLNYLDCVLIQNSKEEYNITSWFVVAV